MAPEGSKCDEITGPGDKRQVTATFAAAFRGNFLPIQILYQGKTDCCHPKYCFPQNFYAFHSPNHWANEKTCMRFFQKIIFPYIKKSKKKLIPAHRKHRLLWITLVVKQLQLLWICWKKKVLLLSR